MKKRRVFITVPLILLVISCGKPDLSSTRGKYSYTIGHQIGKNLTNQGIDIDVKSFIIAVEDAVSKKESRLKLDEMRNAVQEMSRNLQNKGEKSRGADKDQSGLDTTRGKYSYAIGQQIGNNLNRQRIAIDLKSFSIAFEDSVMGKESRLTLDEMRNAMKEMARSIEESGEENEVARRNKKEGEEYLKKNSARNGVLSTASGLQYEILKKGTGPKPKISDWVRVHYRGTLLNGSEFDSSYKRKKPAEFAVKRLIPGWTEALQLMKVGAKYRLTIPGNLGYGSRGNQSIPPNSVLIFELELLGIVK